MERVNRLIIMSSFQKTNHLGGVGSKSLSTFFIQSSERFCNARDRTLYFAAGLLAIKEIFEENFRSNFQTSLNISI